MRKPVSIDDQDNFEEDENGQLYWKGNKLVMETRVKVTVPLPTVVNIFVILAGLAALASAAVAWLAYLYPRA